MKIHKNKTSYKKQDYSKSKDKEQKEKEKEESKSIINNNKIISNEINENVDLSSPVPSFNQNNLENVKNKKNKLYEMIEVEHEKINYRLFFYINDENNLVIELIPKDGYLPYSYKNILDEKMFYDINKIFMELKTIDKIGEKIINLYKKGKAKLGKSKKDEIFYLILKITIIDEDRDIYIPLNKNENIQICTINYLLKEAEKLKSDFSEYKNETEDIIKQQSDEINGLKKTNKIYMKIIKRIKNEYDKKNKNKKHEDSISDDNEEDDKEENNNYKIIYNKGKEKNKENNNSDIDDEELNKVSEIIIDENEQYKNFKNKINIMEKELNNLTKNYRCDINSKYIILNLSMNQLKPFVMINFELENTGLYSLTSKLDDIFCNIEGINQGFISFYTEKEKYITLHESLLPNQKIVICKRLVFNNPAINRKYDFYLNIYTLNHGRISEQPIKFQICIRENEEQENFINFLQNKKWGFDYKNKAKSKNQKIIFEYAQNLEKIEEYNIGAINLNKMNKINDINKIKDENINNDIDYEIKNNIVKIRKYVYDEKAGMAFENKDKDEENNDLDKIDKLFNNLNLDMNIVINNDDVNKIIKRIHNKYKSSKKLNRVKIEEVICSCVGDFQKISNLIENMI